MPASTLTRPNHPQEVPMRTRDRQHPYLERRHTGRRSVDVPVDALGRQRHRSKLTNVTFRADDDSTADGPIGFRGHAAMFDSPTWIGSKSWGFMEQVARGAFAKTIAEADVRFLINHDPNLLLARTKAGNLRLTEDANGLAVDADMAPTSYARDLQILMQPEDGAERSTIDQMSFAFEIVKEEWEYVDDGERGYDMYTITEARLWDVSVVTYPAYDDTDAALRAAAFDALTEEMSDRERSNLLRSVSKGDELPEIARSEPPTSTRSDEKTEPAQPATRDETSQPPEGTDETKTNDLAARMRSARHTLTKGHLA